jgi:hypothetical protein
MDLKEEPDTRNQSVCSQYPKRHRQLMTAKSATILATLLILIIASGFIGYTTMYQPYMQRLQRTAAVEAKMVHIAMTKATQTAQVVATMTFHAQTTATTVAHLQHSYNEMVTTVPDINDDLQNPDVNNWETGFGCSFTDSAYTATVQAKGFFLPCLAKGITVSNFVYQVSMNIIKGDAGGLIVRADRKNTRSYIFVVGQDSSYSIYYYAGNAQKAAQPLADGYSDLIKTGYNHENVLGVLASGTSLDFYINRKYVASIADTAMTSGQVGILANNYKSSTEVIYSHAKIWKL